MARHVDLGNDLEVEELMEDEREAQERASLLRLGRDLAALASSLPSGYAPLEAHDLARLARLQRTLAENDTSEDIAAALSDPKESTAVPPFAP